MSKWNANIKTDKNWFNSILEYVGRPIPMYVLGILTTLFFNYITKSEERPYYFLKTNTINEITTVKLKIGNLGDQALKFSEIISLPSFLVENKIKINIDSFYISSSSREDLRNAFNLNKDEKNNINITLKDEALEKDDYVIIDIRHKGRSLSNNWNIKTRIVGHKDGIINYTNLFSKTDTLKTVLFLWGAVIFLILFRVFFFIFFKKQVHFRLWELIFLIILSLIGGFYLYIYLSVTQHVI